MPLSTDALREHIAQRPWTAHNIRLNDDVTTVPGQPDFIDTDLRLKAIQRDLAFCFGSDLHGIRIADLGCLEGGFSLALAQQGAQVVGIEARSINLEKCMLLKEQFDLPNLEFRLGDVKQFTVEEFGEFDVVLALGILYHLDQPAQWLRQIALATRRLLVIDTHFAPEDDAALARIDSRIASLSPIEKVEGDVWPYEGRWFFEFPEGTDPEAQLWASYSNYRSFWLTKESLLLATWHAGFALVFEQHDYSVGSFKHLNYTFPRTMLVGVKP